MDVNEFLTRVSLLIYRNSNKINRTKVAASDGNGQSVGEIPQSELVLYLSACKFLDTALSFPPDKMPLFQM